MASRLDRGWLTRIIALILFMPGSAAAQSVADRALAASRAGQVEEALTLYRTALAAEPENVAILRDYAVVLGNAGKYQDALPIVRKVVSLDANQPAWALREFAGIYLFGDSTVEALRVLDELVRNGDISEQTLNRRALALRWLGRSGESEEAYRTLLQRYPASEEGIAGLAYSLADEGRYFQALEGLTSSAPAIIKARIRILNWAGRHYEAQQVLDTLPANLREDREVLEDRVAAARWGGGPADAVEYAERLLALYPSDDARRLARDLDLQYGVALFPTFRQAKDNFGLTERTWGGDLIVHLNPAHAVRAGYQYRQFDQEGSDTRQLVRYELGWSGALTRRLSAYAAAATVDYREPGLKREIVGDGSMAFVVNDTLRLGGGGGKVVMDAYPALDDQVTGTFVFGDVSIRPDARTLVAASVSRSAFSDDVVRTRTDARVMRTVVVRRAAKVTAGWRFSGMWHDVTTSDFWSPLRFVSNLGAVQSEGSLTPWFDYIGTIAAGFQSELGTPLQHPFEVYGRIAAGRGAWRGIIELGKSTSSVNRSIPGQLSYSRWIISVGGEFRFAP